MVCVAGMCNETSSKVSQLHVTTTGRNHYFETTGFGAKMYYFTKCIDESDESGTLSGRRLYLPIVESNAILEDQNLRFVVVNEKSGCRVAGPDERPVFTFEKSQADTIAAELKRHNGLWESYHHSESRWMELYASEDPTHYIKCHLLFIDLSRFGWAPCFSTPISTPQTSENVEYNDIYYVNEKSPVASIRYSQWECMEYMYTDEFFNSRRMAVAKSLSLEKPSESSVATASEMASARQELVNCVKHLFATEENSNCSNLASDAIFIALTFFKARKFLMRYSQTQDYANQILQRNNQYQTEKNMRRLTLLALKALSIPAHEIFKQSTSAWIDDRLAVSEKMKGLARRRSNTLSSISTDHYVLAREYTEHVYNSQSPPGLLISSPLPWGPAFYCFETPRLHTRAVLRASQVEKGAFTEDNLKKFLKEILKENVKPTSGANMNSFDVAVKVRKELELGADTDYVMTASIEIQKLTITSFESHFMHSILRALSELCPPHTTPASTIQEALSNKTDLKNTKVWRMSWWFGDATDEERRLSSATPSAPYALTKGVFNECIEKTSDVESENLRNRLNPNMRTPFDGASRVSKAFDQVYERIEMQERAITDLKPIAGSGEGNNANNANNANSCPRANAFLDDNNSNILDTMMNTVLDILSNENALKSMRDNQNSPSTAFVVNTTIKLKANAINASSEIARRLSRYHPKNVFEENQASINILEYDADFYQHDVNSREWRYHFSRPPQIPNIDKVYSFVDLYEMYIGTAASNFKEMQHLSDERAQNIQRAQDANVNNRIGELRRVLYEMERFAAGLRHVPTILNYAKKATPSIARQRQKNFAKLAVQRIEEMCRPLLEDLKLHHARLGDAFRSYADAVSCGVSSAESYIGLVEKAYKSVREILLRHDQGVFGALVFLAKRLGSYVKQWIASDGLETANIVGIYKAMEDVVACGRFDRSWSKFERDLKLADLCNTVLFKHVDQYAVASARLFSNSALASAYASAELYKPPHLRQYDDEDYNNAVVENALMFDVFKLCNIDRGTLKNDVVKKLLR